MEEFDHVADVVVVGSGGGGMATAFTAANNGLDVLMIEKAEVYGGNSALSGGGAWLPNAPMFQRLGETDDKEHLFKYLQTIAPNVKPERHRRFIEEAPKLAESYEATRYFDGGKGYYWGKGYSDYHPKKGGNPKGRGLWPQPIDESKLGPEVFQRRGQGRKGRLEGTPPGMWMTSDDLHDLIALRWGTIKGPKMLLTLAWRSLLANLLGLKMVTSGGALIARLRAMIKDAGVPLWLNTPLKDLIQDESGRVVGVLAERDGKPYRIGARHGVVLAMGGFEGDHAKRAKYQPDAHHSGTQGSPDNTGDWIAAAEKVGAAFDLMDDAWWMPAMRLLPDTATGIVPERQYPHQFIVNQAGQRYLNESQPYTDFGHDMIAANKAGAGTFPSYMIIDQWAWDHYFFRGLPGRPMPKAWLEGGTVQKADTLEELAKKIGVPPENLVATAKRWNEMARKGVDEDFNRGHDAYNNYYGNPSYKNPNMGEVKKPPFYSMQIVLSDLGTKGGMLTDEEARVLRTDGSVITGLYAVGNCSAAVMGNSYAGPGATLGPAMTFGRVAANHIAQQARLNRPAEKVSA